jgi:hypothetical protein
MAQHVGWGGFAAQGDIWEAVGEQVEPEDLGRQQRQAEEWAGERDRDVGGASALD